MPKKINRFNYSQTKTTIINSNPCSDLILQNIDRKRQDRIDEGDDNDDDGGYEDDDGHHAQSHQTPQNYCLTTRTTITSTKTDKINKVSHYE